MVRLRLTDEQAEDLRAILHGSISRFRREIDAASDADRIPKTAFYLGWIDKAEKLMALLPKTQPKEEETQ